MLAGWSAHSCKAHQRTLAFIPRTAQQRRAPGPPPSAPAAAHSRPHTGTQRKGNAAESAPTPSPLLAPAAGAPAAGAYGATGQAAAPSVELASRPPPSSPSSPLSPRPTLTRPDPSRPWSCARRRRRARRRRARRRQSGRRPCAVEPAAEPAGAARSGDWPASTGRRGAHSGSAHKHNACAGQGWWRK